MLNGKRFLERDEYKENMFTCQLERGLSSCDINILSMHIKKIYTETRKGESN
jgi:hypothetical protein